MTDGRPEDLEDRVLVLAPTARDGAASRDLFAGAGVRCVLCTTIADVCREAAVGAGAALVTAEAVVGNPGGQLAGLLAAQPQWSDLPVIVLTPPGPDSPRLLEALEAVGPVTLMKRPVQVSILVSAVRAALRDRRRQYAVRDLLVERERAAETLLAERERYRVTLSSIGDAVIATDAVGGVTFLNPMAESLTGWPAAEASGRALTDVFRIVNEATRRPVENPALRALAKGVVVGLANHTLLIARNGTERPVDDSAAPIRAEDGTVGGAVLVFRDISERKQAEESRARLAAIVESSDDAIIGKTLDGVIRYWNAGAERVFGYTAAEALGRPITLIIPTDRLDEEREIIERLRRGERIDHFETVRATKDGRQVYISLTVSPIRDAEGRVIGASKVARDVTERRRADAERARLAETLGLALDAGELGTWEWDPATDVMTLSPRAGAIYGVDPNRTHRREPLRALLHPDHRDRAREAAARAVETRTDYGVEYPLVTGRWVAARGRGVFGPDGNLIRMIGVVQDVTARREAEAALRASEGRHRILAELGTATQPLTDPAAIMAASARLLVEHLGVDRCAYAEVEDESVYVITGDHARGVPSIVGRWEVGAFGAEHARMMRANEPYIIEDADTDPRVGPDDLPAYRATTIRAVICVPLLKEGTFTAAMAVHQAAPRRWTPGEVDLVTAVVGQCWEALERARVERTLRESEARYRAIVEATPECVKLVAADGTLLQMNRSGLAMVEGDESALGQCVYNVIAPEDRERFRAFNERVCRGERGTLEFDIIGLRGTRRHMETTAVPLPAAQGGFTQLAVTRDVTARKRTEAALRERDERLQLLLGNATDYAVIISDPDDRAVEWLGGAEQITGWRADEAIGQPLDIIFTPEDRAAGMPRIETERAAENGRAENTRWHQRKDGSRFFAEGVTVCIRGPAGELRGFGKVFRDATTRKRAEEDLRASEERYRVLVTATSDIIYRMSADWSALYPLDGRNLVSSNAEPIRGWLQKNIPEFEHDRVTEAIGRAVAAKQPFELEHQVFRPDRTLGWTHSRAVPILDDRDGIVEWFGTARDVTDRKRAAEELAQVTAESERQKRLYETILSATPDFVYVFSLDHRVLYANDALIEMWGRGREGAIGKTFLEIGYESWHAEMHDREIDQVRATKKRIRGEVPFTGTFGRRIYDYIFVPVFGADGEVEAVAGTTRDVTERKAMEDTLREADRKKDEFIALLAHELRNPLAPIRNGLQVMRLSKDPAARERSQAVMDRQLSHMVRMIDDLLDVSRIGRNKMELRRERVTLADVVASAVETARPAVDEAGHELTLEVPPEPIHLDADLTRLAQVLSNLLTNSAKYTPRGGQIWLIAARTAGGVLVSVRDTGIGIPAESLQSVFDMFAQVDRTFERSSGGLGIGLALVKGLVEMHGGTVTAASAGPGRGSTFTVTLPTADGDLGPASATPGATDAAARPARRVLVVDDNRDGAESMADMLGMFGDEVRTAHDGLEAVATAEAFRPEVILMDVGMPRLNGLDATRRIREQPWGKAIIIIALTGWGQETDRKQSREAGCDGHLVKPVSLTDLEKVLEVLGGH